MVCFIRLTMPVAVRNPDVGTLWIVIAEPCTGLIRINGNLIPARPPIPHSSGRRALFNPSGRFRRQAAPKQAIGYMRRLVKSTEPYMRLRQTCRRFARLQDKVCGFDNIPIELESPSALARSPNIQTESMRNSKRWVSYYSVNIRERRQHIPTICEDQPGVPDNLLAPHGLQTLPNLPHQKC